jgi:hypothetical protein
MPEGFQTIPDRLSFENQGAGVAITDFGDGQQHLLVLMVDDPPQRTGGSTASGINWTAKAALQATGRRGSMCRTGFHGTIRAPT